MKENWLNKFVHTMEYYSAIKKNKLLIHTIQMNLKNMLNARIQMVDIMDGMITFL